MDKYVGIHRHQNRLQGNAGGVLFTTQSVVTRELAHPVSACVRGGFASRVIEFTLHSRLFPPQVAYRHLSGTDVALGQDELLDL